MNMELWQKILDFDLDGPISEYPFSVRLCFENGWTANFAKSAVLEYKKFMYLAATSGEMVSPSGVIDVVWHQHLIFTQSYFEFCGLLGKRIDHVPSTRAAGQAQRFRSAKEHTNAAYEAHFGKQPKAYWDFETMESELGLPKAKRSLGFVAIAGFAAFVLLLIPSFFLLLNVYARLETKYFGWSAAAICVLAFSFLENYNSRNFKLFFKDLHQKSFLFDLTPLELIYCKHRKLEEIVHSSVSRLIREDRLAIDEYGRIKIGTNAEPTKYPVTFAILKTVEELQAEKFLYQDLVAQLVKKPALEYMAKAIKKTERYFNNSKFVFNMVATNVAVLLSVYMLVFVRLLTGLVRHRPVVLIGIALVMLLGAILYYVLRLQTYIMRKCLTDFYVNAYKQKLYPHNWDWGYFVAGPAAIVPVFFPIYDRYTASMGTFSSNNDSNGNTSCASCGSSCGSSCGGCGGCGGD